MIAEQHTLELHGCAPTPLAHYLKALGILRLVSEQVDSQARGWWRNDVFFLESKLDRDAIVQFFLKDYCPTPLVAPWNGGSGFFPNDNSTALLAIENSQSERFADYRRLIRTCRDLVAEFDLKQKPGGDDKPLLLRACRNRFPDEFLDWLDAGYVLGSDGPKYPPLLGTGANDGRLEFTNNFMQRLTELFDPDTGQSELGVDSALDEALFREATSERSKAPVGQFDPGSAGGANAESGFGGGSRINIWDFVLMLEGSLIFAAAAVKKLGSSAPGALAYPFCVRTAGVGYSSADQSDESLSRAEMWMPLWRSPVSMSAVSTLFGEARVETNRRTARNGVDFARALASYGVDRGIDEFERFGFQQRNGLAYFAVPLGRFKVRAVPAVEELLAPLDRWLDRFRRAATSSNAPARAGLALRNLESSILALCQRGTSTDVQALLISLGEAEAALVVSRQLRETGISPLPALAPDWLIHAQDNTPEFRVAAALAGIQHDKVGPLRRHFEPLEPASWSTRYPRWAGDSNDPAVVWGGGGLVRNLNAVLKRRMIQVLQLGKQNLEETLLAPLGGRFSAPLTDVAEFIEGNLDDRRIETLLRALILINWRAVKRDHRPKPKIRVPRHPDAAYALLKLCHLPYRLNDAEIRLTPVIAHRAIAGDGTTACRLAARRLNSSGLTPATNIVFCDGDRARRTAAALMIPISSNSAGRLYTRVLRLTEGDSAEEKTEPAPAAP